jgi:hypothetical protein
MVTTHYGLDVDIAVSGRLCHIPTYNHIHPCSTNSYIHPCSTNGYTHPCAANSYTHPGRRTPTESGVAGV